MEISRILRVLITLILVVTFIVLTVSAYRRNQEVNSMTVLSDATSSIATKLTTKDLVWVDEEGVRHPHLLDPAKLENADKSHRLAGENFTFRTSIVYFEDNSEREIGPYGDNLPEDRMRCSLSVPVALRKPNPIPAKLKVVVWYA